MGIAHVHWISAIAQQQTIDAFHQIIDITEATGLTAIAEHSKIFTAQGLSHKCGQHTTIV